LISQIAKTSPSGKLYIFDARPKKNAVANQVTGGGYENCLNYENVIVGFGNISNIHQLYDSWYKLFRLLNSKKPDETKWLSSLESTQWLGVR
jgi:hypothetical protein